MFRRDLRITLCMFVHVCARVVRSYSNDSRITVAERLTMCPRPDTITLLYVGVKRCRVENYTAVLGVAV